jgi:hypothetical protein
MAKHTLELSETEVEINTLATALFMKFMETEIERHKNHKDYSMDKLFALMEMYVRSGDIWVRLQKLQGATQEEIAQYLSEQEV